jgi:hypothetical protein
MLLCRGHSQLPAAKLKWDAVSTRGGDLFLHYYSGTGADLYLPVDAIVSAHHLPWDATTKEFAFPAALL